MGPELSLDEVRARLLRSEGPAALALDVHALLRERMDGVENEVAGVTAVGGGFSVRRGEAAVRVHVVWLGFPQGFWALSLWPVRKFRKRRMEQDVALIRELQPPLAEILNNHLDASPVVWMTDDEAKAYPL